MSQQGFYLRFLWSFFVLAFSLSSYYVFSSGNAQPVDMLLAAWILLVSWHVLIRGAVYLNSAFFLAWTVLVLYVTLVNFAWSAAGPSQQPVSYIPFYLYNWLVGACLLHLLSVDPERGRRCLKGACFYATVVSLILFVLYFDFAQQRQTGGFNNPNQLGYFSLLMFCCAVLLYRRDESVDFRFWFIAAVSAALVFFSYSLTALGALGVAAAGLVLRHNLLRSRGSVLSALGVASVVFTLLAGSEISDYFNENLDRRVNRIEAKTDDVLAQRAYDRITLYPQYLFLGAGEGARHRFPRSVSTQEMHSTAGTILFSYGLVGSTAFLTMVFLAVRRRGLAVLLLVSAPLLYGLTHNGLRTTSLWLLFIIAYMLEETREQVRKPAGLSYKT